MRKISVLIPPIIVILVLISPPVASFQSNGINQRHFSTNLLPNRLVGNRGGGTQNHASTIMNLFQNHAHLPPPVPVPVPVPKRASLAISGKLFSTFSKLMIGPEKAKAIFTSLVQASHPGDVALIVFFGWCLVPICHFYNKKRFEEGSKRFVECKTFRFCTQVSEIARIAGLVFLCDFMVVALKTIGVTFPYHMNFGTIVAKISYLIWFANKLVKIKTQFILRKFQVTSIDTLGIGNIYDRVGNLFISLTTALVISDVLALETGRAFSSIFALGSVGTLVFSLASKDVASQFIGGLALSASNRFHEGEQIKLGDSTAGIVNRVGWMNTELRGFDEIIMKIPNSQLAFQRVSNISRMRKCQVKQFLWIGYDDIKKIPQFIEDVKVEIRASCPFLIDDGTRPFYVHWREFASDHLEIVVDTHHNIKPSGVEYYDNRQAVLMAISRAAVKNQIEFAVPTVQLKTSNTAIGSVPSGDVFGLTGAS